MKENEIQSAFRHWLDKMGVVYINPRMDRVSTISVGMPDFCLTMHNRCLYIEVKTEKGILSEDQCAKITEIRQKAGIVVLICRGVEDCIRTAQDWLGTVSATSTLGTQKDASTGMPEGKEGQLFGMPVRTSTLIKFDSPVNGTDIPPNFRDKRAGETLFVDGTFLGMASSLPAKDGQAFLDNIPHVSERIGEWQGQKWVIRMDERGQEYFVRRATVNDLTRLAANPRS